MITQRIGSRYSFVDSTEPKVFRVPGLGDHPHGGLIGYFGNAFVRTRPMAVWLQDAITQFPASPDTSTFPPFLLQRLQADARATQLRSVQGFHIGAFERRAGHRVPVFWFLRNSEISEATGQYQQLPGWAFRFEEQLLARDYATLAPRHIRDNLRTHVNVLGTPLWYRNGDLGVAAAAGLGIDVAAQAMSRFPAPGYRRPASLERWGRLASAYVTTASALAQVYFRAGTPTIGGRVVSVSIPWN